jgi:hypothetical protein
MKLIQTGDPMSALGKTPAELDKLAAALKIINLDDYSTANRAWQEYIGTDFSHQSKLKDLSIDALIKGEKIMYGNQSMTAKGRDSFMKQMFDNTASYGELDAQAVFSITDTIVSMFRGSTDKSKETFVQVIQKYNPNIKKGQASNIAQGLYNTITRWNTKLDGSEGSEQFIQEVTRIFAEMMATPGMLKALVDVPESMYRDIVNRIMINSNPTDMAKYMNGMVTLMKKNGYTKELADYIEYVAVTQDIHNMTLPDNIRIPLNNTAARLFTSAQTNVKYINPTEFSAKLQMANKFIDLENNILKRSEQTTYKAAGELTETQINSIANYIAYTAVDRLNLKSVKVADDLAAKYISTINKLAKEYPEANISLKPVLSEYGYAPHYDPNTNVISLGEMTAPHLMQELAGLKYIELSVFHEAAHSRSASQLKRSYGERVNVIEKRLTRLKADMNNLPADAKEASRNILSYTIVPEILDDAYGFIGGSADDLIAKLEKVRELSPDQATFIENINKLIHNVEEVITEVETLKYVGKENVNLPGDIELGIDKFTRIAEYLDNAKSLYDDPNFVNGVRRTPTANAYNPAK